MAAHAARPIVRVSLLPNEWRELDFKNCCESLMRSLSKIEALGIKGFDDLIILFPTDRMKWGAGTDIPVVVELPLKGASNDQEATDILDTTARVVVETLRELLPSAYIQCNVIWYSVYHGYWSTTAPALLID